MNDPWRKAPPDLVVRGLPPKQPKPRKARA
jgi:hypothetical protein